MPKTAISFVMLAIALGAAGPAAADPVTRVIAPNGSGIECSLQVPCNYTYALNSFGSATGDTVLALPGTYDVTTAPVAVDHRLTIIGDPAQPRPVFTTNDPNQTTFSVYATADGTVLKHLDIRASGAFDGLRGYGRINGSDLVISGTERCALLSGGGSVLENSTLTTVPMIGMTPMCLSSIAPSTLRGLTVTAPTGTGVDLEYGGSTLEDSTVSADKALLVAEGPTAATIRRVSAFGKQDGLALIQGGTATVTDSVIGSSAGTAAVQTYFNESVLHLRNDTIVATAAGAAGIEASAATGTLTAGQIDARDVIVKSAGPDLRADVASNPASCTPAPCAPGQLAVDHSAFSDSAGPLADGGSNVAGDPGFVSALDFHLTPGSPAIDAGVADGLTQGTDRDGHARFQGNGLDMGAYEATPIPAPTAADAGPAAPSAPAAPAPDAGVTPDLVAPVLSNARVTNRVFAVGRQATAVSARKRAKLGTTFRYTLSEAATVKIDLARRAKNKRYRHVVTLTRAGRAGTNATKLSGRIKRRALKPGAYRATLTARDAAGNTSRRVVLAVIVVPSATVRVVPTGSPS